MSIWPFKSVIDAPVVESAGNLIGKIGDAFDKNFTSSQEKLELRNDLVIEADKLVSELNNLRTQVLIAELSGTKLQRVWRPLLMLIFGGIIVSTWFLFPIINLFLHDVSLTQLVSELKSADNFWEVVKLGVGGYVIGRSVEKIAESVSESINVVKK